MLDWGGEKEGGENVFSPFHLGLPVTKFYDIMPQIVLTGGGRLDEKTIVSLQMTQAEKAALREAANREKRSLSNFLLTAALNRAQERHGIIPEYEDESVLK